MLTVVLERMDLVRSTCCHARTSMKRPGKYTDVYKVAKREFEASSGRYGYRRIWLKLKASGIKASEKVIRRIMAEGGMVAVRARKRMRYS